jgi:hypothetical protein
LHGDAAPLAEAALGLEPPGDRIERDNNSAHARLFASADDALRYIRGG